MLIGQMVEELDARHRLDKTYFILCSDHGHHGGQTANLSHYDLADEFFYKPRLLTPDGNWVGGGLGLSVRQHRFWNRHPEDRPIDFVFVDGDQDGQPASSCRTANTNRAIGTANRGRPTCWRIASRIMSGRST